jgi:hypothetical protein
MDRESWHAIGWCADYDRPIPNGLHPESKRQFGAQSVGMEHLTRIKSLKAETDTSPFSLRGIPISIYPEIADGNVERELSERSLHPHYRRTR